MEQDLPAVRSIYETYNTSRTGTFARSWAYWQNQPRWRAYDPDLFLVAKQGDQILAYLKARPWALREFGYLPAAKPAMLAPCAPISQPSQSKRRGQYYDHCPCR